MYLSNSQVAFYDSTFRSNGANKGGALATDDGGVLEVNDLNMFFNNTSSLGSVISACDGTKVSVNISDHLFVSVDQTLGRNCVSYSTDLELNSTEFYTTEFHSTDYSSTGLVSSNNAMSNNIIKASESPLSFTIFIISFTIFL